MCARKVPSRLRFLPTCKSDSGFSQSIHRKISHSGQQRVSEVISSFGTPLSLNNHYLAFFSRLLRSSALEIFNVEGRLDAMLHDRAVEEIRMVVQGIGLNP